MKGLVRGAEDTGVKYASQGPQFTTRVKKVLDNNT